MLDRRWRAKVEVRLQPAARNLRHIGLTADRLTALGLAASLAGGLLVGSGHLGWAALALLVSGLLDVVDGSVAKASGTAGPRGAFVDSVADRFADAFLLGGVAWYFTGTEPRLAVLALAVLAASLIVSYERARAESLGFDARGGLMERAERLVMLFVGLAFGLLEPVLWAMLVLSLLTAVQRFVKVWRQAAGLPAHDHVGRWRFSERARVQRITQWWPARRDGLGVDRGSRLGWRGRVASARRRTRP